MKKVWKSVNIWWSYGQEFGVLFFDSRCGLKDGLPWSSCWDDQDQILILTEEHCSSAPKVGGAAADPAPCSDAHAYDSPLILFSSLFLYLSPPLRMDPLRFQAGCRKRRLKPALDFCVYFYLSFFWLLNKCCCCVKFNFFPYYAKTLTHQPFSLRVCSLI